MRDALTPKALERILGLGTDVLVIEFGALVAEPGRTLDAIARLCGTEPFGEVDAAPVNRAEAARSVPLAAAAKLAAWTLRTLGARRTLQALKDNPRIVAAVFRPARPDEMPELGAAAAARLDRQEAACREVVKARCEPLGDGLWFARVGGFGTGGRTGTSRCRDMEKPAPVRRSLGRQSLQRSDQPHPPTSKRITCAR